MSSNPSGSATSGGPARNPFKRVMEFLRQVRQEANKVVWPTRKETGITTGMVFVMSIVAALFFFLVDWIISHVVKLILGLGG
jgi:preprotein translocase subunit SecE